MLLCARCIRLPCSKNSKIFKSSQAHKFFAQFSLRLICTERSNQICIIYIVESKMIAATWSLSSVITYSYERVYVWWDWYENMQSRSISKKPVFFFSLRPKEPILLRFQSKQIAESSGKEMWLLVNVYRNDGKKNGTWILNDSPWQSSWPNARLCVQKWTRYEWNKNKKQQQRTHIYFIHIFLDQNDFIRHIVLHVRSSFTVMRMLEVQQWPVSTMT